MLSNYCPLGLSQLKRLKQNFIGGAPLSHIVKHAGIADVNNIFFIDVILKVFGPAEFFGNIICVVGDAVDMAGCFNISHLFSLKGENLHNSSIQGFSFFLDILQLGDINK